jgi:hypothetical protein
MAIQQSGRNIVLYFTRLWKAAVPCLYPPRIMRHVDLFLVGIYLRFYA